jgi:hypothetical protein
MDLGVARLRLEQHREGAVFLGFDTVNRVHNDTDTQFSA